MKFRRYSAIAGVALCLALSVGVASAAPPPHFSDTLTITDSTGSYVYSWSDDISFYTGVAHTSGWVNLDQFDGYVIGVGGDMGSIDEVQNLNPLTVSSSYGIANGASAFLAGASADFDVDMNTGGTGSVASFQAVPEPASLACLTPAILLLLSRRTSTRTSIASSSLCSQSSDCVSASAS